MDKKFNGYRRPLEIEDAPLGGVLSTRQNDQGGRVSGHSGRSKGMATAKGTLTVRRQDAIGWLTNVTCLGFSTWNPDFV